MLIQLEYTIDKLSNLTNTPAAPNVSNVLLTFPLLSHGDRQNLLAETTAKAKNTLRKLEHDFTPNHRLGETFGILRACRYWNYKWLADQSLETLETEIVQIHLIAGISATLRDSIFLELKRYKQLSLIEMGKHVNDRSSLWTFFIRNKIEIPKTYLGACEVAIISPSSGSSERVFAMYTSTFNDQAKAALEDRREASIMLRMNQNWRQKEL
jgi:hypothetical protein